MFEFIKKLLHPSYSKNVNFEEAKDVTVVHPMNQSCTFHVNIPGHAPRSDSPLFIQTRHHLVAELDTPCWVCGGKENRQVHHRYVEMSLSWACDFNKVKLDHPNFPDWDKVDPNNPETFTFFVDHPYQMMVLCQNHHTGTNKNGGGYGIHFVPEPIWAFQKYVKDDFKFLQDITSKDTETPEFIDDLS